MPLVARIRDGRPDDALALEALHRRSANVWAEYRDQLAAHPDAIVAPHEAIADGRVRVAVDASDRLLGFSVVLPLEDSRCELDDLFVEPTHMYQGVGRVLVDDLAARAAAGGATYLDVVANPNATGFYARLGFQITGNSTTRFGDAPSMTLKLNTYVYGPRPPT
jgi:GNAT superfamily N-acetyltransferase